MATRTYTIDQETLNIIAYESRKAALAAKTGDDFATVEELDALMQKLAIKPVALWNSIPGLTPVSKFMDRKTGLKRIWRVLESLDATPDVEEEAAADAPKAPREDSKQHTVVEMLKNRDGATLDEIMDATGWQRHTVRGFIAGTAKRKLGLNIVSFKNATGERTYRVVA